jgi:hypothetical protein
MSMPLVVVVLDWLAQQPKDFFSQGINVLVEG